MDTTQSFPHHRRKGHWAAEVNKRAGQSRSARFENNNYTYDAFGNAKTVKIGNQPLVTYAYRANNGTLSSLTYGNGSKESYNYNEYGEPTKKTLSGLGNYTWIYDSQGKIIYSKDTVNSQKTYYKYDDEKRYVGEKVYSTVNSNAYANFLYSDMNVLDDEGRIIKNTTTSNGLSVSTPFTYSEDGKTTTSAMTTIRVVTTNYNDDGQVVNRSISTDTPIAETFSYKDDAAVATHKVNNDEYSYTYDDSGNITEIKKNNVLRQSYVYDSKNQLVRDNNLDTNKTTVYTYDNGGNISNKKEYAYTTGDVGTATSTKTYTYDATWKDKLTNFNGQEISYDAIGNPTTYRGATTTWFGRQMQSYSKGSTNVAYKYDENGLRTSKIVNGVQYDYYYVGDKLIYEKKGDEYDLFYRYDADGRLALVEKRRLSDNYRWYYYVVTNSRGDVLEIHNGPGELTAKYTYDAWGKLISVKNASGAALSTNSFAYQISVRYRGYVYDNETGLYYLQSRYYDPETGRFLNADDVDCIGTSGTEAGYNAFAYCENEPISRYDPNGFKYSPAKAKKYADKWWDSYNPAYKKNKSDCANFVSQCLYAGGLSKMTGTGKSGWHNQWEHYWYIPTYSYISGKPVMTGFNGKKMKISDAWGKASELYKWLKNNKHIKETTTLNNKKDVTNLVKKLVKNKNTKPCIAAIFFIRDGKIHHAALSGYIESNKKKKEYDIYFYGHTSARCGKKIKYYDKRGNAYYSSLARSFKTEDKYYFCILK